MIRIASFALFAVSALAPLAAFAQIHSVQISYSAGYVQDGIDPPTAELGCDSSVSLFTFTPAALSEVIVTDPNENPTTLGSLYPGSYFDTINSFTIEDALNARPAGPYVFEINGGTMGVQAATVVQPYATGNFAATIPAFSPVSYETLTEDFDPGSTFVLDFTPFTPGAGATVAWTNLEIYDFAGATSPVAIQLEPGDATYTVGAGTLAPNAFHRALLTQHTQHRYADAFPGAITAVTFSRTTFFDFTTGSIVCVADVDDGSGNGTPDGGVDISDLLYFLTLFDAGGLGADVDDGSSTGTPDGGVDISDLLYFLARFDAGC